MKALVKFADGRAGMELRDIPKPEPKSGELLIKVMAAGICGTDLHIMFDEYPAARPVVMGHEYTGTVEAVGSGVIGFLPGDQVISLTAAETCGHCIYCRNGQLMLCSERRSIGSGVNGAMSEYMTIPAELAYKIPPEANIGESLALSEPLACCIRAVNERSPVKAGDVVVVSGPGVIGQLVAQLAKLQGAYVILSGIPQDEERLALATRMGTADAASRSEGELLKLLSECTVHGADIVYECAGAAPSLNTCLKAVRKAGHYAQVGLFGKPVSVPMDMVLTKELSFSVSFASEPSSWDILMKLLIQKKLQLNELTGPKFSLSDWNHAFDCALNKEGYKVLLIP